RFEIILFAFAVSIDSFSVGITLTDINENYLLSALSFSIASALFTFLGLKLGNKIAKLVGKLSTIIGGLILIIIGLMYIF
ncbi:manganese efflux pump, partial [Salmonella enterica]|uniref:manganese efflux pump n=1 Tax=Salmonella enterica TaxID=28901 RepID=UPI003297925E